MNCPGEMTIACLVIQKCLQRDREDGNPPTEGVHPRVPTSNWRLQHPWAVSSGCCKIWFDDVISVTISVLFAWKSHWRGHSAWDSLVLELQLAIITGLPQLVSARFVGSDLTIRPFRDYLFFPLDSISKRCSFWDPLRWSTLQLTVLVSRVSPVDFCWMTQMCDLTLCWLPFLAVLFFYLDLLYT